LKLVATSIGLLNIIPLGIFISAERQNFFCRQRQSAAGSQA